MVYKSLCILELWLKVAIALEGLILRMLRLSSSKAQGCNEFCVLSKPCHVGIHWIALTEYPINLELGIIGNPFLKSI